MWTTTGVVGGEGGGRHKLSLQKDISDSIVSPSYIFPFLPYKQMKVREHSSKTWTNVDIRRRGSGEWGLVSQNYHFWKIGDTKLINYKKASSERNVQKRYASWIQPPPPIHGRPDRKILCLSDVCARYHPNVRGLGMGGGVYSKLTKLDKVGGSNSQFLVGRLWWMTPLTPLSTTDPRAHF